MKLIPLVIVLLAVACGREEPYQVAKDRCAKQFAIDADTEKLERCEGQPLALIPVDEP